MHVSPKVKRMIEYGVDKTLSPTQRETLSKEGRTAVINRYLQQFLQSPLGIPFRETLRRRTAAVVLGTPYGEPMFIVHAVDSLTRLAVASLTEDTYGKVSSDVPTIIRVFVSTINSLDSLKAKIQPHWTDVEASNPEYRQKSLVEADLIQARIKRALVQLIDAFGKYADVIGMGKREMRMARQTAGMSTDEQGEMVQQKR